jgi:hypothetical protein
MTGLRQIGKPRQHAEEDGYDDANSKPGADDKRTTARRTTRTLGLDGVMFIAEDQTTSPLQRSCPSHE